MESLRGCSIHKVRPADVIFVSSMSARSLLHFSGAWRHPKGTHHSEDSVGCQRASLLLASKGPKALLDARAARTHLKGETRLLSRPGRKSPQKLIQMLATILGFTHGLASYRMHVWRRPLAFEGSSFNRASDSLTEAS